MKHKNTHRALALGDTHRLQAVIVEPTEAFFYGYRLRRPQTQQSTPIGDALILAVGKILKAEGGTTDTTFVALSSHEDHLAWHQSADDRMLRYWLGLIGIAGQGDSTQGQPRSAYDVDSLERYIDPTTATPRPVDVGSFEYVLTGSLCQYVLDVLAETGRCFFSSTGQRLTPMMPQEVILSWQQRPNKKWQLAVSLRPGEYLLLVSTAIYLQEDTGGFAELPEKIPLSLLVLLANQPPLSATEAYLLHHHIAPLYRPFIPEPPAVDKQCLTVAPQPELRVRIDLVPPHSKAPAEGVLLGTLFFRYGAATVAAADTEVETTVAGEDAVIVYRRNLRAEKALRFQATKLGISSSRTGELRLGLATTLQQLYKSVEEVVLPLKAAGWRFWGLDELDHQFLLGDRPVTVNAAGNSDSPWFNAKISIQIDGQNLDLTKVIAQALSLPNIGLELEDLDHLPARVYIPTAGGYILTISRDRALGIFGVLHEFLRREPLSIGTALALQELCDTKHIIITGDAFVLTLAAKLRKRAAIAAVSKPKGLRQTLYNYQKFGISWLAFLRDHGLGGILADEMGLGKTLQILAHVLRLKETQQLTRPVLVVAPSSILFNWQDEAEKFTPSLRVYRHHGQGRATRSHIKHDLVLTSYQTASIDSAAMARVKYDTIVLDESHSIKNPRAQCHRTIRKLKAKHRICLSGTPIPNNLEELWAQFAFCMPALLGPHDYFSRTFRTPIEKHNSVARETQLLHRVRPFMLQRKKEKVAKSLPPKKEETLVVTFRAEQADLYETIRSTYLRKVRDSVARRGLGRSHIVVLEALTKLKQVCCDGRLLRVKRLPKNLRSAKLTRLMNLVFMLMQGGRRALVFSQYTGMLDLIALELQKQHITFLQYTGKTKNRQKVVRRFQQEKIPILLVSLKAGGVGLNFTAADVVIHYDLWWNPAIENQATDRTHRIGQVKPVTVYKLIAKGTLEERINSLQRRKRDLSDRVMAGGSLVRQLTTQDIENLLAPIDDADTDKPRGSRTTKR